MSKSLQIIIPMTGNGSRFKAEGYERLKPFIKVHGTPMIEWVIRMFPGYEDCIKFICRDEHLDYLPYVSDTLMDIAPEADILRVENWEKLGPVNDVLRVSDAINDDDPVIISYCDFFMLWDFEEFLNEALERCCEGAIPCYSDFHPHLLPAENLYASCKVDVNDALVEIREKYSWTTDKTQTRHSPGIYFFKTGKHLKHYFQQMIDQKNMVSGEYYASLPFNYMVQDGGTVWCPINASHFCQWGTPADLQAYELWVNEILKRGRK